MMEAVCDSGWWLESRERISFHMAPRLCRRLRKNKTATAPVTVCHNKFIGAPPSCCPPNACRKSLSCGEARKKDGAGFKPQEGGEVGKTERRWKCQTERERRWWKGRPWRRRRRLIPDRVDEAGSLHTGCHSSAAQQLRHFRAAARAAAAVNKGQRSARTRLSSEAECWRFESLAACNYHRYHQVQVVWRVRYW